MQPPFYNSLSDCCKENAMPVSLLLVSSCLVAIIIAGLLVSACILAGRLDRLHCEGYEEP